MKIRIKLYATLGDYLPAGAKENEADLEVPDGTTPSQVIAKMGLPSELCHLVLINGVFIEPSARSTQELQDGDALAMWPPVAGG